MAPTTATTLATMACATIFASLGGLKWEQLHAMPIAETSGSVAQEVSIASQTNIVQLETKMEQLKELVAEDAAVVQSSADERTCMASAAGCATKPATKPASEKGVTLAKEESGSVLTSSWLTALMSLGPLACAFEWLVLAAFGLRAYMRSRASRQQSHDDSSCPVHGHMDLHCDQDIMQEPMMQAPQAREIGFATSQAATAAPTTLTMDDVYNVKSAIRYPLPTSSDVKSAIIGDADSQKSGCSSLLRNVAAVGVRPSVVPLPGDVDNEPSFEEHGGAVSRLVQRPAEIEVSPALAPLLGDVDTDPCWLGHDKRTQSQRSRTNAEDVVSSDAVPTTSDDADNETYKQAALELQSWCVGYQARAEAEPRRVRGRGSVRFLPSPTPDPERSVAATVVAGAVRAAGSEKLDDEEEEEVVAVKEEEAQVSTASMTVARAPPGLEDLPIRIQASPQKESLMDALMMEVPTPSSPAKEVTESNNPPAQPTEVAEATIAKAVEASPFRFQGASPKKTVPSVNAVPASEFETKAAQALEAARLRASPTKASPKPKTSPSQARQDGSGQDGRANLFEAFQEKAAKALQAAQARASPMKASSPSFSPSSKSAVQAPRSSPMKASSPSFSPSNGPAVQAEDIQEQVARALVAAQVRNGFHRAGLTQSPTMSPTGSFVGMSPDGSFVESAADLSRSASFVDVTQIVSKAQASIEASPTLRAAAEPFEPQKSVEASPALSAAAAPFEPQSSVEALPTLRAAAEAFEPQAKAGLWDKEWDSLKASPKTPQNKAWNEDVVRVPSPCRRRAPHVPAMPALPMFSGDAVAAPAETIIEQDASARSVKAVEGLLSTTPQKAHVPDASARQGGDVAALLGTTPSRHAGNSKWHGAAASESRESQWWPEASPQATRGKPVASPPGSWQHQQEVQARKESAYSAWGAQTPSSATRSPIPLK